MGLNNWLGKLIGFPQPLLKQGTSFSLCYFVLMKDKGRERAVAAKLLIVNINNKATGMLIKSELLEAYPLKISDETRWNQLG